MLKKSIQRTLSLPRHPYEFQNEETRIPVRNRLKRSISENSATQIRNVGKRMQFHLMPLAMKTIMMEKTKISPEKLDALHSKSNDVRIAIEQQQLPVTINREAESCHVFYRTFVPNIITAQHVWFLMHTCVTISLLVLYFRAMLGVSAGVLAVCELLIGVSVRNEIFLAYLHRWVAMIPWFKYEINRMLHCIGGLHVSSACCSFLWLLISLCAESHGFGARISGGILLTFIITISFSAIPVVRRRYHNTFEYMHRYAGWTSLIILIVHIIFLQIDADSSFRIQSVINAPVIILLIILIIIALPWLWVRRVSVQFSQPSKDLTLIEFPRALYPYGSTTRISFDGREWHAFAIALSDPIHDQHSILVAAVGDWTKKLAENYRTNQLANHIWIRRIKGLGFMYSIHAYRRVLIVCTGSGIAPALPYIKNPLPTIHTHLLWIAKQHENTYGEYVWTLVKNNFPYVTLHDTSKDGRPGSQLIEDQYRKADAEAIFVVSNEKFTNEIVNAMWYKGIPAFGALFDS